MHNTMLTDSEFNQFQTMIFKVAGINLSQAKKQLVYGRLNKRLSHHGLSSFGEYFHMIMQDKTELQMTVDLLTTNETYFFREPKHMDFMREHVLRQHDSRRPFRLWCAACSSGEEAYSLAMLLTDHFGQEGWEIIGSDISSRVLDTARKGHYSLNRTSGIPRDYLSRFCLKGVGSQEGTFLVDKKIRDKVSFTQINLNKELPRLGQFDVIFLRNVMIYFSQETKKQVVARLLPFLRPGGFFIVSHSESLSGLTDALTLLQPSVYVK